MTDLVERLRKAATKPNGWAILGADAATEAADEIERLQRELHATDSCAHDLIDAKELLEARVAELERDAARYRWLRGRSEDYCGHACFPEVRYRNGLHDGFEAKTVDEAVDAAMGAP